MCVAWLRTQKEPKRTLIGYYASSFLIKSNGLAKNAAADQRTSEQRSRLHANVLHLGLGLGLGLRLRRRRRRVVLLLLFLVVLLRRALPFGTGAAPRLVLRLHALQVAHDDGTLEPLRAAQAGSDPAAHPARDPGAATGADVDRVVSVGGAKGEETTKGVPWPQAKKRNMTH